MKRPILYTLLGLPVLALLIQLVPLDRTNPAVVKEPPWDSPQTRELARRACMDCHGNQTVWPWYSHVAPVSWFVVDHVKEAREKLNFSDYDGTEESEEMIKEIRQGDMPLSSYTLIHQSAKLSEAEKDSLVAGLRRTFDSEPDDSEALEALDSLGHDRKESSSARADRD